MPASHLARNDGVLSSHTHSPALDHPPSLRVKLEPGPETSDGILDDGLGAQVTGHLLFHGDFHENESAPAEEDPVPSGQDLVVHEGEPEEEPAAAAAGAPLKWPEMRPDEIVVDEMKKFATANGAQLPARDISNLSSTPVVQAFSVVFTTAMLQHPLNNWSDMRCPTDAASAYQLPVVSSEAETQSGNFSCQT